MKGRPTAMQHRYVGDIGDYVKLAILRALSRNRSLGVAWWLFPDESHNGDGRHLEYLDRPREWRGYDRALFDALDAVRGKSPRDVRLLEGPDLLPGAVFCSVQVPSDALPISSRAHKREQWLQGVTERLSGCDLVFVDPDNGVASDRFKPTRRSSGKSVSLAELKTLSRCGRAIIVYHHQSRRKGGHLDELGHVANRLAEAGLKVSGALRAKPWSPRAFFLLGADAALRAKAEKITETWEGWISWHPDLASVPDRVRP
jgi:hypothetical protein